MMIKTTSYFNGDVPNCHRTWDDKDNVHILFDRVYEVISITDNGFLISHNKRFYVIPFERAEQVSPLEAVL